MLTNQQIIYCLVLTFLAVGISIFALTRWRLRWERPTARTGSLLLWCGSLWIVTNALQLASTDLQTALVWGKVEYFAVAPIPVLWLFLALQFTDNARHLTRRRLLLLGAVPAASLVVLLTNGYQSLFISRAQLEFRDSVANLVTEAGPVMAIFYLYGYLVTILGTYLLAQKLFYSRGFRWQGSMVLLGVALVVGANILDWSRLNPIPQIKLTPLALVLAIPIFIVTLLRTRRADVVPIARTSVIQIMQDAVLVLDIENRVIDLNPAAEDIIGHQLTEVFGKTIDAAWPVWVAQTNLLSQTPEGSTRIQFGEGDQVRILDMRQSNLKDWRGNLLSRVFVLRDITERAQAEESLKMSEEHFRALTENATDSVVIVNRDAVISYASPSIERVFGFTMNDILGKSTLDFIHPDDLGIVALALNAAIQSPRIPTPIIARFRQAEGGWHKLECTVNNLLDHPTIQGIVVNARDITERVVAEELVRASLAEKEILLKEIHHRVKNNLQIIVSLLNLQSNGTDDPYTISQFRDSQNRVRSMALIHERLYRSDDLARLDFGTYLRDLTAYLLNSYEKRGKNIVLNVEADDIHLDIDMAIPCGLLVVEMVSNALKHAFPGERSGAICVEMQSVNESRYRLAVCDDGVGFPANVDYRETSSLGLQLVNSLTRQLGGTVDVQTLPGTTFTICFPKPALHPSPQSERTP